MRNHLFFYAYASQRITQPSARKVGGLFLSFKFKKRNIFKRFLFEVGRVAMSLRKRVMVFYVGRLIPNCKIFWHVVSFDLIDVMDNAPFWKKSKEVESHTSMLKNLSVSICERMVNIGLHDVASFIDRPSAFIEVMFGSSLGFPNPNCSTFPTAYFSSQRFISNERFNADSANDRFFFRWISLQSSRVVSWNETMWSLLRIEVFDQISTPASAWFHDEKYS